MRKKMEKWQIINLEKSEISEISEVLEFSTWPLFS